MPNSSPSNFCCVKIPLDTKQDPLLSLKIKGEISYWKDKCYKKLLFWRNIYIITFRAGNTLVGTRSVLEITSLFYRLIFCTTLIFLFISFKFENQANQFDFELGLSFYALFVLKKKWPPPLPFFFIRLKTPCKIAEP